jgi:hypothetical protein
MDYDFYQNQITVQTIYKQKLPVNNREFFSPNYDLSDY